MGDESLIISSIRHLYEYIRDTLQEKYGHLKVYHIFLKAAAIGAYITAFILFCKVADYKGYLVPGFIVFGCGVVVSIIGTFLKGFADIGDDVFAIRNLLEKQNPGTDEQPPEG